MTAERAKEDEPGTAPNKAQEMFAAPIPINSWFGSIFWPLLAARRLGDRGRLQHTENRDGYGSARQFREQMQFARSEVKSGEGGDHGGQGPLVLDQAKGRGRDGKGEEFRGDPEHGQADEGLGPPGPQPAHRGEDPESESADPDRPKFDPAGGELRNGLADIDEKVLTGLGSVSQDIMYLTCNQQDADSRAVADHDRSRDELGDFAKIEEAGKQLDDPDEKGEIDRQLQRLESGGVGMGGNREATIRLIELVGPKTWWWEEKNKAPTNPPMMTAAMTGCGGKLRMRANPIAWGMETRVSVAPAVRSARNSAHV